MGGHAEEILYGLIALIVMAAAGFTFRVAWLAYTIAAELKSDFKYTKEDLEKQDIRLAHVESIIGKLPARFQRMEDNAKSQLMVMERLESYVLKRQKKNLPTVFDLEPGEEQ